jgi:hypothetical protein
MISLAELLTHSGLPGPRGNLELFYRFLKEPDPAVIDACLALVTDHTADCPEEFAGMCGVAGWALLRAERPDDLVPWLRRWAGHPSWRIREAVAMALQELRFPSLTDRCALARRVETGDPLVLRALVAGLCEPKNLKDPEGHGEVLALLSRATGLLAHDRPLTEPERVLRQALGYAWSVAAAACPALGLPAFEAMSALPGRHVAWIAAENLKKKRMPRG